jgi:hypothetical protein
MHYSVARQRLLSDRASKPAICVAASAAKQNDEFSQAALVALIALSALFTAFTLG